MIIKERVSTLMFNGVKGMLDLGPGWSANWKVTGLIPGQGTCLGCGPGPWVEACKRQLIDVSVIH